MENILVTSFPVVPPFAQGLVRDLRVRWALEEAGMAYSVDLVGFADRHSPEYLARHPFGMVPAFESDGRKLFETGAILYEIGCRSDVLMPAEAGDRAEVLSWMFAALNTVEPSIQVLSGMDLQHADEEWVRLRRPAAVEAVQLRLTQLADWLGDREYLTRQFSVADILMTTVLRLIRHTDLVEQVALVDAYKRRCESRPAFEKALREQLAQYRTHAPLAA